MGFWDHPKGNRRVLTTGQGLGLGLSIVVGVFSLLHFVIQPDGIPSNCNTAGPVLQCAEPEPESPVPGRFDDEGFGSGDLGGDSAP